MSNLVDTAMNIEIFLFVGLLIWLYLNPASNTQETNVSADPVDKGSDIETTQTRNSQQSGNQLD